LAACEVLGELAGPVRDGICTGYVGIASGKPLLVVELLRLKEVTDQMKKQAQDYRIPNGVIMTTTMLDIYINS
jgi:hypothetical protein